MFDCVKNMPLYFSVVDFFKTKNQISSCLQNTPSLKEQNDMVQKVVVKANVLQEDQDLF